MVPHPDKHLYDKSKSISLDMFYTNVFLRNQEWQYLLISIKQEYRFCIQHISLSSPNGQITEMFSGTVISSWFIWSKKLLRVDAWLARFVNQNVEFVCCFFSLDHWIQVIIMVCGFFLYNILWIFPFLFIPTAITIVKSLSLHPEDSLNSLLVGLLSPISPYFNPSYPQLLNLPFLLLEFTVASYCLRCKPELLASSTLLLPSTL